jgi:hypothetical protein
LWVTNWQTLRITDLDRQGGARVKFPPDSTLKCYWKVLL